MKGCDTINTHRIQIALKVAETLSISKAASALFLTQPSVSNALTSLENEIGFLIFDRSNKGLKITPKGQEFLNSAMIISEQMDYISHLANRSVYCRLHLTSFLSDTINRAFISFCDNHRDAFGMDISYNFFSLSVEDAVVTLHEGRADVVIALCREDQLADVLEEQRSNFEIFVLDIQESLIAMSPDLPLAHEPLTPDNVREYPILLFEDNRRSNYYIPIGDASKLKSTKTIMVQNGKIARDLAVRGIGIMFCEEENTEKLKADGLICRPLGIRTAIICMYKKDKQANSDIIEFTDLLKRSFQEASNMSKIN